jgi:hypothetical protein
MNRIANLKQLALIVCKRNSKQPATKNGLHDARFGVDVEGPQAAGFNVGLACKSSGFITLDLDVDDERGLNGIGTIRELELELGQLPKTLTQITPRTGRHLIFSDEGVVNPIGKIGKDVDVKWKGYILCEPSTIDGKPYRFTDGIDEQGNFIIAKLPQKWLDYINKPNPPSGFTQNSAGKSHEREIFDGDFQKMFTQCLFIRHCVDNAEILSEPDWHLFACVLNSLSNGAELFDYYSQPHPDYKQVSTQKKFKNASKYNVTCDTIYGVFVGCKQCTHRKQGA